MVDSESIKLIISERAAQHCKQIGKKKKLENIQKLCTRAKQRDGVDSKCVRCDKHTQKQVIHEVFFSSKKSSVFI